MLTETGAYDGPGPADTILRDAAYFIRDREKTRHLFGDEIITIFITF